MPRCRISFRQRSLFGTFLFLTIFSLAMPQAIPAQGVSKFHDAHVFADSAASTPIHFEVLSIRPVDPKIVGLGATTNPTPVGFVSRLTLYQAVMLAYAPAPGDSSTWQYVEVVNMPAWTGQWYDIKARVADEDVKRWRNQSNQHELLREAMRVALKERCNLSLHEEKKEAKDSAWDLVAARRGPKFKPASPNSLNRASKDASNLPSGGVVVATRHGVSETDAFYGATMSDLVWFLSASSPARPIHDKTGLSGRFDFKLEEVEHPSYSLAESMYNWPIGPLGLLLRPSGGTKTTLVIERIDRPSPN